MQVRDNPASSRYEITEDGTDGADGAVIGFAAYQKAERLIVFTHTEVEPAFEGRGVGGALARYALDEVAEEGTRKVMPLCPFIKAWIGRHTDYRPLVYGVSTGTEGR